jgi:AraC-like DNA-binding protein/mannose-6-phosphate isomerase-like protein (cupin superfamily)
MRVFKTEDLIEKGKSIHIFSSKTKSTELHTHDFIELIYVCSGSAEQIVDGQSFSVTHGDIIFMNYGSTHAFGGNEDFEYINICFSPETLGDAIITPENAFSLLSLTAFEEMRNDSEGGKISFFGNERREIEEILHAMLKEYKEKSIGWYTVIESYLNILITRMLRKTELSVGGEEIGDVWRELADFIDANLQSELTLSALASKCFYNPSYFSRAFKKQFGMSLTEYLNRRRIERAMQLARESDWRDEQIAEAVGFSYKSSFYRVFQRVTGKTFAQFKRESLQK